MEEAKLIEDETEREELKMTCSLYCKNKKYNKKVSPLAHRVSLYGSTAWSDMRDIVETSTNDL